jgi:hypothetical protein
MNRDFYLKKISEMDLVYDIGVRPMELKRIAAKFEQQKTDLESEDFWASAIRSAMRGIRDNPLEADIRQQVSAANRVCPICSNQGIPITLMGGKNAYYCKIHKVVLPAAVEE